MKPAPSAVAAARAARPVKDALPRVLLAAVPVASLGMLCPVPSLLIALRRQARAHWLICAGFSVIWLAWMAQALLTPVDADGLVFLMDVLLLLLATLGPAAHCLVFWRPARVRKVR
ncbi:hypothetical protein [Streptomyces sp. MUM 178J]|uniref:hypothetical protein n=1 Tax=Streptomyces sp. MUM 178J TaxID=2791991 RepID=UPI001F048CA8|nr:hypothetical protein [Streptomyces sp. MUM 178J]WRQ79787.1 hypothetical protein I3F59_010745 [Streptomyces sp. MUM 178J]